MPNPLHHFARRLPALLLAATLVAACATGPRADRVLVAGAAQAHARAAAAAPERDYLLWVVSESSDDVQLVRFGPGGARVDRRYKTGMMPTEINGPHGVAVAPDGRSYYVSVSHGTPFGTLWKYAADGDSLLGRATLGHYPATVQVTPDGAYAFVANFNVYGDMVPSSVSVVSTAEMAEVARIRTCTMPHGSRFNAQGTRHYSTCMMDDLLVEIDAQGLEVSRHLLLTAGRERGMAGAPAAMAAGHVGHATVPAGARAGGSSHAAAMAGMAAGACSPTWAQPSVDGGRVYVACSKSNEIVEVDVTAWRVSRRWTAGDGVYNLATSPDGRLLVATNKKGQSVSVYDVASARELARIPTRRKIVHGAVVSPDNRYAFITVEGIGSEPGTLEVIDLAALATVATVDLGQQAAGVDFFRMETPARR